MNGTNPDGTKARYVSSPRAGIVTEPGGVWSVLFKGTSRSFVVPRVYFDARLVVLNPTVTIDGGVLNRVDWVYWDRLTGDVIPTAPSFIRNVQVVLSLNNDFVEIESPLLDRSAISYTVPSQPSFGDARELSLDSVNTTSCGFVSVVNDGALGPFPSPVLHPADGDDPVRRRSHADRHLQHPTGSGRAGAAGRHGVPIHRDADRPALPADSRDDAEESGSQHRHRLHLHSEREHA
jgi:hypothetical protein